jgi:hypothetical protein
VYELFVSRDVHELKVACGQSPWEQWRPAAESDRRDPNMYLVQEFAIRKLSDQFTPPTSQMFWSPTAFLISWWTGPTSPSTKRRSAPGMVGNVLWLNTQHGVSP